jgi:hypothetical protein
VRRASDQLNVMPRPLIAVTTVNPVMALLKCVNRHPAEVKRALQDAIFTNRLFLTFLRKTDGRIALRNPNYPQIRFLPQSAME